MSTTLPFDSIIGQEPAKKMLGFYLNGYARSRKMPYLMITAAKGKGKTLLARELGKHLVKFDERKNPVENEGKPVAKSFLEINAAAIRSVKHLINGVFIPNVVDKDVTVFIDEAHELKHDVTNAFLTILNPGSEQTTFVYDDYVCDFDHCRQTFIFATSESHKVFSPLMDRVVRVDLRDYTDAEMGQIVCKHLGEKVRIDESALSEVTTVLRGSARAARKMATDIQTFLQNRTKFTLDHWSELKDILGLYPLGLNTTEISILRFLRENTEGTSLTKLASKTGLSVEAVRKDYELHLLRTGLMCIETSGRHITKKGLEYLKSLEMAAKNAA
jgi:Holliday junction resolvasome RuvABC ATP-dependent DNA helicase subunit